MKDRTCCFSGHRFLPNIEIENIKSRLSIEIDKLYKEGKREFISGGALGFDQIAAEVVLSKRKVYKDILLLFVLPCKNQHEKWNQKQKEKYEELIKHGDNVIYISEDYNEYCIHGRNMYMVDASSVCICYLKYMRGGTLKTVRYAVENEVEVINIAK